MVSLTLYKRDSCPYCQRVMGFMRDQNIKVPLKDISDPDFLDELIQVGGKRQVPCLFIDGKALYESDAIIDWLKEQGTS